MNRRQTSHRIFGILLLLTACLPLRAATLGNASEGTFAEAIWQDGDYIHANRVQATSAITVDRMFAKVKSVTGQYKVAIYHDSSGNPGTLLRETAVVANPAEGWNEFAIASPVTLAAGTFYWFAIWSDSPAAEVFASEGGGLRWGAYPYGAWPGSVILDGGPAAATCCLYAQSRTLTGPAIRLRGSDVEIADGDTTPQAADDSDFGPVNVTGGTRARTFTIYNPGTALLTLDFTPQSLFPAAKTGNDSGAEGNHYELGTVFSTDLAGSVTHLRVYALASETGDHTARVWRNSDSDVIGGPYTWNYGGTTHSTTSAPS